jgi:hypothetical protein
MPSGVLNISEPENNNADSDGDEQLSLATGFMNMLSIRSLTEYVEQNGVDLNSPENNARIHIFRCSSSLFRFPNKLASMFIEGCSECKLQYNSVISSVEMLKVGFRILFLFTFSNGSIVFFSRCSMHQ